MDMWFNIPQNQFWEAASPDGFMHKNPPHQSTDLLSLFEAPDWKDNVRWYGARLTTFFRAPLTANYTFFTASATHSKVCIISF
jgi:hypothetical protein